MLRLDPVCRITLPDGTIHEPARLLADHHGRAAVWTPNNPHPVWTGQLTPESLDRQPSDAGRSGPGPWHLDTVDGRTLDAARTGSCRCGYGDLLARGEHDLAPLDIPA